MQCTVKNSSNKKLTFCQLSYFGPAFENNPHFHASEINSHLSNLQEENAEPEFSEMMITLLSQLMIKLFLNIDCLTLLT